MTCANCKYFNRNEAPYPEHLGWCGLELPAWLNKAIPNLHDKIVRVDDYCSFLEEKK